MEPTEILKANWSKVLDNVSNAALGCGRRPDDIKVVAVSKIHSVDTVRSAISAGIDRLGENYVQEMKDKYDTLSAEQGLPRPEWHFIGHLQSNKVKYIAPFVDCVHSVDSLKLAREISKRAAQNERSIDIMLQVNSSGERSKSGCKPEDAPALAASITEIENINLIGLMTIGSFSEDEAIYRAEFRLMRGLKEQIESEMGIALKHLSMGMTHDYEAAVEEGATYVRVGTAIFGPRNY